jgi:glycosyltransferase involved in cell wall biosynthesis
LDAALAGGRERAVMAALEGLADGDRPMVASIVTQRDWPARWRAVERSTPHTYALGGVFADELHADVVHALIVRHGVERVIYLEDGGSPPWVDELRRRSPDLPIDALHPVVKPPEVAAGDGGRLRDALGWPQALIVAMCADLIPEQRPEDFVALAHRLRDDHRFRVLLVGDGPLAADVRDLGRLFDLDNLRALRPERDLGEVLAATDVVCSTAERDPFPHAVPAALLHHRPVVAAAGDLRRLLEAGPCGVVVAHPGDLEGFEQALRSLTDDDRRHQLGERGPGTVRAFYQAIDD